MTEMFLPTRKSFFHFKTWYSRIAVLLPYSGVRGGIILGYGKEVLLHSLLRTP